MNTTDIVAKIDGHPIRAFNVANHMCVVAEDLRAYGFDVVWYADERMLTVALSKTVDPASFPAYVPEPPKGKIGSQPPYRMERQSPHHPSSASHRR